MSFRRLTHTNSTGVIERDRQATDCGSVGRSASLSVLELRSIFTELERRSESADHAREKSRPLVQLRESFAAYRSAESRLLLRLCLACAYFVALRGPRWLAHSQRDYASALLGVPHSSFLRWARVGRLLAACPQLRAAFRNGRLSLRALDDRARHGELEHGAHSAHSADSANEQDRLGTNSELRTTAELKNSKPRTSAEMEKSNRDTAGESTRDGSVGSEFVDLAFAAPVPALLYLEDSMVLARAMVGRSHGDEEALAALLAEASSEASIDSAREATPQREVARARRRFGVKDDTTRADASAHERNHASCERELPHPKLPALGERAQRRHAFRVHTLLRRLMARRDRLRVQQEDQLYEWMLSGTHERCGFPNFERFASEILELPRSSCNDRLRRARERRRNHPIALARARGEISIVQADLLARLHRHCHVPVSDLGKWIRFAIHHTVRCLRSALAWARRQLLTDYRHWSLGGCRPPQADQLRTVNHSLEVLVSNPEGHTPNETLREALLEWNDAPRGTMRFRVRRETRDELLVQLACEQDYVQAQAETPAPRKIPAWLALCRIFHRARRVWAEHHVALPTAQRRILDRDGWRCAAPECTQRRNLQIHHLQYRARGGDDRDSNRVTLCAFHHQIGEHQGLMRVRGEVQTDGTGLTWEMGLDEYGRPHMVYRDGTVLVPA